jgi:citrate synthase
MDTKRGDRRRRAPASGALDPGEDPRARVLRRTCSKTVGPLPGRGGAVEGGASRVPGAPVSDRALATNVEFWSAAVLDLAEVPPDLFHADVRVRASGRLVGSHPQAEA